MRICIMDGVREHDEGFPVELWRDQETGRLAVVARNEGSHNSISLDLMDLVAWLRCGNRGELVDDAAAFSVDLRPE